MSVFLLIKEERGDQMEQNHPFNGLFQWKVTTPLFTRRTHNVEIKERFIN